MFKPDFAVIHAQVVQVDGVVFEFSSFAFAEEQGDAKQRAAALLTGRTSPLHLNRKHVLQLHKVLDGLLV